MKTLNGLPVYKMTIDEFDNLTGVEFISLVDAPAIEVNWVALSKKKLKLFAGSVDKQILTGPAMIPDMAIYRSDEQMGEYYVSFDKSEIESIQRKFNKEKRTLGINYQHQSDSQVSSAVIIEQWFITDKANDKSNAFGFDLPVGTWMVSVYIADKEFWTKEIKSGNVRGFSIEGFLNLEMKKIKDKMNKTKMTEIKTEQGIVLTTPADSFIEGSEVFITDAEGKETPAPDGDYVLDNGSTISVAGGKVTAVVTVEASTETEVSTKLELAPEEIASIADALGIADLIARIEALEAGNAEMKIVNEEMKAKFSKLPGSTTSATDKHDNIIINKTKMSLTDKVNALRALKNK